MDIDAVWFWVHPNIILEAALGKGGNAMKRISRTGPTPENTFEEVVEGLDSIELTLGAKGEYRWVVKVYGSADSGTDTAALIGRVADLDALLRLRYGTPVQ